MLTVDDLGITTTLPDFCKGCPFDSLELEDATFYANGAFYDRRTNVTCMYIKVCTELYERLKKEGKIIAENNRNQD